MKKLICLTLVLFMVTGCTFTNNMEIDEIIKTQTKKQLNIFNQHRNGYKYYLPKGLKTSSYKEYNEEIKGANVTYYLYVDVIAYINKSIYDYEINEDAYFSQKINYKDKYGYIEIKKLEKSDYIVEIMYNYAKIEVIVEANNINDIVVNSMSILSSIEYNKEILDKLVGKNILQYKETEFEILEPKEESNYLKYKEQEKKEDEDYDSDLID